MKVSLTLPSCRAEVPAKCRYHGNGSKEYAKMLKNKMLIAARKHIEQEYDAIKQGVRLEEIYREVIE